MKFFHRYKSSIHGNYRKAYLRCGALSGVLLMLYVMVRYLLGVPAEAPEGYAVDGILLAAVVLLTLLYRNALEEKRATLKELMLFGMGTAVLASVLYGLFLWCWGLSVPSQTVTFTKSMANQDILVTDPQLHYWAAWWGIVAGVKLAVLGAFGAFLGAIFFKNEKAEIQSKQ